MASPPGARRGRSVGYERSPDSSAPLHDDLTQAQTFRAGREVLPLLFHRLLSPELLPGRLGSTLKLQATRTLLSGIVDCLGWCFQP